jgi:hypothetical protein
MDALEHGRDLEDAVPLGAGVRQSALDLVGSTLDTRHGRGNRYDIIILLQLFGEPHGYCLAILICFLTDGFNGDDVAIVGAVFIVTAHEGRRKGEVGGKSGGVTERGLASLLVLSGLVLRM